MCVLIHEYTTIIKCMHSLVPTRMHTCMHAFIHADIHSCMHEHIHTCTVAHVYIYFAQVTNVHLEVIGKYSLGLINIYILLIIVFYSYFTQYSNNKPSGFRTRIRRLKLIFTYFINISKANSLYFVFLKTLTGLTKQNERMNGSCLT